jgi:hypothetical protein
MANPIGRFLQDRLIAPIVERRLAIAKADQADAYGLQPPVTTSL